jgi:predicted GNAT family acetyltransferase
MNDVTLKLNEKGEGGFYIMDGDEQLGEMAISVSGNDLSVYHTEVAAKAEGKGLAKKLLESMVNYARNNKLKVIPYCPFVLAQFKRHPHDYADLWSKPETNH